MRRRTLMIALAIISAAARAGWAEEPVGSGEVLMTLLTADGNPAANMPVEIHPADVTRGNKPLPEAKTRTDAQGRIGFAWPAGTTQLWVTAHPAGGALEQYGVTGTVVVKAGEAVTPPLPPLVPKSRVVGELPAGLPREGVLVRAMRSGSIGRWGEGMAVVPDATGRFSMELISGEWNISVRTEARYLAEGVAPVVLVPGGAEQHVVLRGIAAAKPQASVPPAVAAAGPKSAVFARGTVRDEKGQPIADAEVYAFVDSITISKRDWGGEPVLVTHTDARGHYEFSSDQAYSSGSIYVAAKGKPLGWSYLAGLQVRSGPVAVDTDVTLADAGGGLEVRVLGLDGKPAADARVMLDGTPANFERASLWKETNETLLKAMYPVATTDARGVAHFEHLPIGVYRLIASSEQLVPRQFLDWMGGPWPHGVANGIAVRAGVANSVSVHMLDKPPVGALTMLNSDGSADLLAARTYHYHRMGSSGDSSSSRVPVNGVVAIDTDQTGLWQAAFQHNDEGKWFANLPPYVGAEGYFAVSRLLPAQAPLALTGIAHQPGGVTVELQDEVGKPVRGYVQLVNDSDLPMLSGSADAQGRVAFAAVPEQETKGPWNRYLVTGTVAGMPRLDLRGIASPAEIPVDAALANRKEYLARFVTAANDQTMHATLKPEAASYVRGRVTGVPTGKDDQFYLYFGDDRLTVPPGATVRYFPETGDYIAGPVHAGELEMSMSIRRGEKVAVAHTRVTVKEGAVTRQDLQAPGLESVMDDWYAPFLDDQGRLPATVLLADGKTPAAGAQLVGFYPGGMHPVVLGTVDAAGRASGFNQGVMSMSGDPPEMPAGSPPGYVLLAAVPGTTGYTMVTVAKPLTAAAPAKVVLPPAMKLRGQVRVEGLQMPVEGRLRVLAAFAGLGKLAPHLSAEITPDAEGFFELSGLTPGKYRVQAALDDLWFSESAEMEVKDHDPEVVRLSIAAVGAPMKVFVGAGNQARVTRPAGPLTEQVAPASYLADGKGFVYVATVEAGEHTVSGNGMERKVAVPRATAENSARAMEVRLAPGRE